MRSLIIMICLFIMINHCEARGFYMKRYVKKLNDAIHRKCNKEAYNLTNNTELYNCVLVYKTNNYNYIKNFTDYINIKNKCIDNYNSEFGSGIVISIALLLIFSLLCK